MARLNRDKRSLNQSVETRINWLLWMNTALILGLYILVLLEKFKWNG